MHSLIITVVVAVFLWTIPAFAQQACGDRSTFINRLEKAFGEHPIAMGLTHKGAVLEVFASKEGTWTFLITMPNGLTCVVASGDSWETLAAVKTGAAS